MRILNLSLLSDRVYMLRVYQKVVIAIYLLIFFSMQVLYRVGVGLLLTFELIACVYSQGMS